MLHKGIQFKVLIRSEKALDAETANRSVIGERKLILERGLPKAHSFLEIHQMTETGKCSVLQVRKSSENTNMKCTTSKKETKKILP